MIDRSTPIIISTHRPMLALAALGAVFGLGFSGQAHASPVEFQLLTWTDAQATGDLPSAVGRKPTGAASATGDWLVFTPDDQALDAGNNPSGALSHNLADIGGIGGASFNMAPSLSGVISLDFSPTASSPWGVSATSLAYAGQATSVMAMNQFLVTPNSAATQNSLFNVDGVGNSGTWNAGAAGDWSIQYNLDFYFATNADGDPLSDDVDATFNDKTQSGYLIPTVSLTESGLSQVSDSFGFYDDFARYLLDEIAPRLPDDATYLLVTQMDKTHPDYAESGLPVTTGALIGNVTFAYATTAVPEPSAALLGMMVGGMVLLRRRRLNRMDASEPHQK